MDPSSIKKVSLEYCKGLLTNRNPNRGYEVDVELKNELHDVRMNEVIEGDCSQLSYQQFCHKNRLHE